MLTTEQFKFLTFFTDFTGSGELVHENKFRHLSLLVVLEIRV